MAKGLRLVASLALLAALVIMVGPEDIARQFRAAQAPMVLAAFVLIVVDSVVRTASWRQLLAGVGVHAGLLRLNYCLLAGGFFGSFIPSTVGTDAARSVFASRVHDAPVGPFAATIVSNSIIGLLAVCLWGAVAATWCLATSHARLAAGLVLAVSAGGMVCIAISRAWAARLRGVTSNSLVESHGWRAKLVARMRRFGGMLLVFGEGATSFRAILSIAMVNQAIRFTVLWLIAVGVGAHIPWIMLCLFGPLLAVAAVLPVSVSGFGIDQAGFVGFFTWLGVAQEQAFVVSVINSALYVALNFFGGLLYVVATARRVGAAPSAEGS